MNSALISYLLVGLFWGSTYLAIRIGVQHMPPAIMAALRFLAAGILLLAFARLTGRPLPRRAIDWRTNIIVGILLLAIANGLVVWSEQFVESGIAAIFVVTVTLWMVVFSATLPGPKERPHLKQIIGLLVGFAGTVMLVGVDLEQLRSADWRGPVGLTVAAATWGLGSVYSQRRRMRSGPIVNSALQMLIAGVVLLAASVVRGEWQVFQPSWEGFGAVAYLAIFGSIVGFTAYLHLLRSWPAALAGTYTYVNVVVAVFLGWLILDEPVTARTIIAAAIVLLSVALVRGAGPRTRAKEKTPVVSRRSYRAA